MVKKLKNNYECGLNIDKFNDIKIGDLIETYEEVEMHEIIISNTNNVKAIRLWMGFLSVKC